MLPVGLLLGASTRLRPWGDRVLARTIVIVGLMLMVGAIYVVTVIGLGRVPEGQERTVLLLSMAAAGVAALLAVPARRRLEEFAERHVDGLGRTPDDALKTFAGRMTRAVPMDELLLQLAESLQSAMAAHIGGDLDRDGGDLDQGRLGTGSARHPDRADRRGVGGGRPLARPRQQLDRRVVADAARRAVRRSPASRPPPISEIFSG